MKKICAALIIMMLVFTMVAADTNVKELMPFTDDGKGRHMFYVAHADDATYVAYLEGNKVTHENDWWIGKLKGDDVDPVGELDELSGQLSTPNDYDITGMVQFGGDIYISTPYILYKMVDERLEPVQLYKDKEKVSLKYNNVQIGALAANDTSLYIHLKCRSVIVTADSDNVFATPLDALVVGVDQDGKMHDTGFHAEKYYLNTSPHFALTNREDKIFFTFSDSSGMGTKNKLGIHKAGENQDCALDFDIGDITGVTIQRANVLMYDDRMLTYRLPWCKDYIEIKELKEDQLYRKRNNTRVGGIYTVKEETLAKIEDTHYIAHWTIGDDGYVYMLTIKGAYNIALIDGYRVLRFKP